MLIFPIKKLFEDPYHHNSFYASVRDYEIKHCLKKKLDLLIVYPDKSQKKLISYDVLRRSKLFSFYSILHECLNCEGKGCRMCDGNGKWKLIDIKWDNGVEELKCGICGSRQFSYKYILDNKEFFKYGEILCRKCLKMVSSEWRKHGRVMCGDMYG